MATVTQVGPRLGIAPTCAALGLPRATYYRRRRPQSAPLHRPSPRALSVAERSAVLAVLLDRLLHHAHVLTCGPQSWCTRLQGERSYA